MNKQQQRSFGITQNLLKEPVPRFYGAGKHKVQLAYITPAEANLLTELDLHDSDPPNPGPAGIPNFNDPGTGMSGVAASAAEAGSQASASDAAQAAAEGVGGFVTGGGGVVTGGGGVVTGGGFGIGPDGSTVNYGDPTSAYGLGVSPNIPDRAPSFGVRPMRRPEQPPQTSFQFGLPSLDQLSKFSTDVNKFAFDPTLGIVSLATGFPIGAVLGLANAFGLDIGPAAPEDKSETRGREPVDTPLTAEQVDPFAGDAVKSKRYKDFMLAGYPPDMAEYLVNQLM